MSHLLATNPLRLEPVKGHPNLIKITAPERKEYVNVWRLADFAMMVAGWYLLGLWMGVLFFAIAILHASLIMPALNATPNRLVYAGVFYGLYAAYCIAAGFLNPVAGVLFAASCVPMWIGNTVAYGNPFCNSVQRKDALDPKIMGRVSNPEALL